MYDYAAITVTTAKDLVVKLGENDWFSRKTGSHRPAPRVPNPRRLAALDDIEPLHNGSDVLHSLVFKNVGSLTWPSFSRDHELLLALNNIDCADVFRCSFHRFLLTSIRASSWPLQGLIDAMVRKSCSEQIPLDLAIRQSESLNLKS